jgi:hypothetical protein
VSCWALGKVDSLLQRCQADRDQTFRTPAFLSLNLPVFLLFPQCSGHYIGEPTCLSSDLRAYWLSPVNPYNIICGCTPPAPSVVPLNPCSMQRHRPGPPRPLSDPAINVPRRRPLGVCSVLRGAQTAPADFHNMQLHVTGCKF